MERPWSRGIGDRSTSAEARNIAPLRIALAVSIFWTPSSGAFAVERNLLDSPLGGQRVRHHGAGGEFTSNLISDEI